MGNTQFKISNIFSSIAAFLKTEIKSEIKFRSFNKQYLADIINRNINNHTSFLSPISALNKEERITLFRMIQKSPDIKKYPYMLQFRKSVVKNAYNLESDIPFESIIVANKAFISINKDLLKNIDKIIKGKEIVILGTNISTYAFMGILEQSDIYGLYSQYLLDLCMVLVSKVSDYPKYRDKYLKENFKFFSDITNNLCNTSMRYSFLKELEIINKKGIDFKINVTDENTKIDSIAKVSDYSMFVLNPLSMIPFIFNIFKMPGEMYLEYKHDKIEKIKQTKEWLETRVALLKMELSKHDKDDIEYIKLENIVRKYEDIIIKQDQKLNNYLEG